MAEQVPVPDTEHQSVELVLNHQPLRKSFGFRNIFLRRQASRWRELIALALLKSPADLPCWRWRSPAWPPIWEQIRLHPLRAAMILPVLETLRSLRSQWKIEGRIF